MFFRGIFIVIALQLKACSLLPANSSLDPVFLDHMLRDDLFVVTENTDIEETNLFYLSPEMAHELEQTIRPIKSKNERFMALRQWAFDTVSLYNYDVQETANIRSLQEIQKINCASFSILFTAAARHVGIPAIIQLIRTPGHWLSKNNTLMVLQHMNVVVAFSEYQWADNGGVFGNALPTHSAVQLNPIQKVNYEFIIDINPNVTTNSLKSEKLNDNQVLSRYHSNLAAKAIVNAEFDLAYFHSKRAILADNSAADAWNNLGVLYSKVGHLQLAKTALNTAIQIDPTFESASNNLYAVHLKAGDENLANELRQTIFKRMEINPYYHFTLGKESIGDGNYSAAITHFEQAISLKKDEQLFYLALAKAQIAINKRELAKDNLNRAHTLNVKANRHADIKEIRDLIRQI